MVGDEFQNGSVDAVALVGGGVEPFAFENVAEVAVTGGAADFDALHAGGGVDDALDVLVAGDVVEGGPAAAGVELVFGGEELGVAAGAVVGAGALFFEFVVDLAEGAFGAVFAEDFVLFGGEFLFPLFVGFLHGLGWLGGSFFGGFDGGFVGFGFAAGGGEEGHAGEEKGSGEAGNGFHGGWVEFRPGAELCQSGPCCVYTSGRGGTYSFSEAPLPTRAATKMPR